MPDQGWRSLLKPSGSQIVMAILLGGLAFAMTVELAGRDDTDYSGVRKGELVELLQSLDSANDRVNSQVDDLSATRDDLLSTTERSEQAAEQARKQAEDLAILAGSVGATGQGVRLTITDPKREVDASGLLDGVDELRDAGAEVIVINGTARIVAQTYFLDDGQSIRIDGREIKRPFVIEAIGDPNTLAEAVRFRGGLLDKVESRGGNLTVETRDKITITALADVKPPEYARPTS